MTRARKIIITATGIVVLAAGILTLTKRPVLLSLTDPGELQRPSLSIFNPLRDKGPERAADDVLLAITRGNIDEALKGVSVGGSNDENVREKERQYPLHAWKLVNRQDTSTDVTLFYRTARETVEKFDSPLIMRVESRNGRWHVTRFSPVY